MPRKRSTVEDIARAAGVSLMTVSRAINGRPGVGAETRRAILELAGEMGYRPNRVARNLASRRTSTLGIVFPDMANPFFAILAKAATDVARAAGLNVFIVNTDEDPALELEAYDSLLEEDIDGVIIAASRLPRARLFAEACRFRTPVLVNSEVVGEGIANVDVDDRSGMLEAVAYLAGIGRRRLGFVAGPSASGSSRRRLSGFKAGLALAGMPFDPLATERCVPDVEGGMKAIESMLARCGSLDAIVAYNDIAAIGVLRGLEKAGLRIPEDVAVIGVDDVPYASLVRPALSTLRTDIAALGSTAMSLLLDLRAGKPVQKLPPLTQELVLRGSA